METFSITSEFSGDDFDFRFESDGSIKMISPPFPGLIIGDAKSIKDAEDIAFEYLENQEI